MNTLLLLSTFGTLLFALLGLWHPAEKLIQRIYFLVPIPALILAVLSIDYGLDIGFFPDLILGTQIGLDRLGRAFLILISAVWLFAGIFSRNYPLTKDEHRLFRFSYLVTFSGAAGLTVALDAPSFYAGYALMTIGGYGLVVNVKTMAAMLAGRVYFVVAFFGEMLTFAGIVIAASRASGYSIAEIAYSIQSSEAGVWSFWFIFIGFGTKVGLVPLHFWLPRSYYWAPLPAVALLSGAMTKAGVLGWLRFLNGFESNLVSMFVLGAGILMAFYGVFFGVLQTRAKTTLAFSSLSQMGYLTIGFATLIEQGAVLSRSLAAVVGFAIHHGLTKLALFLGLGVLTKGIGSTKKFWLIFSGLTVCSLSLVGFPLTGGAFVKELLKEAGVSGGTWSLVSNIVMTLGSAGTALIMLRFLTLTARGEKDQILPSNDWVLWSFIFGLVLLGPWLFPFALTALNIGEYQPLTIAKSIKSFLPVLALTLFVAAITLKTWRRQSHLSPRPFDIILQGAYKAVWEDFPRDLDRFINRLDLLIEDIQAKLQLERKFQRLVAIAKAIKMEWLMGCTLFMAIGVLIWSLLAGGQI